MIRLAPLYIMYAGRRLPLKCLSRCRAYRRNSLARASVVSYRRPLLASDRSLRFHYACSSRDPRRCQQHRPEARSTSTQICGFNVVRAQPAALAIIPIIDDHSIIRESRGAWKQHVSSRTFARFSLVFRLFLATV